MFDKIIGTLALRVLAWLGRRADKRGDFHEAAHCTGAVLVGHSTHTDEWPCSIIAVQKVLSKAKEDSK